MQPIRPLLAAAATVAAASLAAQGLVQPASAVQKADYEWPSPVGPRRPVSCAQSQACATM